CATLLQAVVHDRDPRLECRERSRDINVRSPMMGDQVRIHGPDETLRTSEIEERLPTQIANIEKAELAVADDNSRGARVFIRIAGRHRVLLASGSDGAGSREGSEERRACRAYDRNFEVIQRQTIPGGGLEMLASASQHRICAERGVCLRDRSFSLGTWVTMIDEYADRKSTRLNFQSPYDLVCRLLLEKKKKKIDVVLYYINTHNSVFDET